ncbi:MAG: transglycosylase SLT domain-containing protein [Longimicrobiales bacterium]
MESNASVRIIALAAVLSAWPTVAASAWPVSEPSFADPASADRSTAGTEPESAPEEALRAMQLGRFLHASLILREHFATIRDTSAADLLLAARAEAGWGNWERVERLLDGRVWLDTLESGLGWDLLGQGRLAREAWKESAYAFARYLSHAANLEDEIRGIAELRRARAHTMAKAYADAFAAYESATGLLPEIEDWIALRATGAAAAAGDTARVSQWLARADPVLAEERAWAYRIEALKEAGQPALALAIAESAASSLTGSSARGLALVAVGELRLERGDIAAARDAFRNAVRIAAATSAGVDAARNLSELPGLTASDQLLIGRTYLRHGNLERGIAGLEAYIDARAGTVAERERLRWDLGQAQFRAGRYDDAERTFLPLSRRQAESSPSVAADALFYAARSQYRDGRVTLSRRTLLEVPARFPRTDGAARALFLSADLEQDGNNIDRAVERFRATVATGADIEEVGLAYMRLGGIAFQKEDFTTARSEFDRYRSRYPDGRRYIQATYWSALASQRLDDDATTSQRLLEVRRLDPFSYYGGLAADLLGTDFWDVPLRDDPVTSSPDALTVAAAFVRIDLLRNLEWNDAVAAEIQRFRRDLGQASGATFAFAEALNERGFASTGIAIGWDLFQRSGGWNRRLLRIIYPFPYRDILVAEATEQGVDPFLAAGLIRQESMFNPDALSGAGAIGLMQVMPATGRVLAARLGVHRFDEDILRHAEFNAHLGMAYLDDQLTDYDGRLPLVLAAYNAGPHRVTRWSEFPEFTNDELFAERIPFAETRDYVKIVQNNARIYEALYAPLLRDAT